MKSLFAITLPLSSLAWINTPTIGRASFGPITETRRSLSSQPADNGLTETDNPCWQDIWNYDCAMSNIYSASFIAKDWIKSMPCAMGIAVSCFHDALSVVWNYFLNSWAIEEFYLTLF